MAKKLRVIERKLGKHKAVGLAWTDNVIEIDPRQSPKDYLDTLIHEKLHILFPDKSERWIIKHARALSQFLWDNNYRKASQ